MVLRSDTSNGHWGFDMRLCPWHMVLRSDTSNGHWGFYMRLCPSHMSCLIKSFLKLSIYHFIFSSMIYSSWLKANINTLYRIIIFGRPWSHTGPLLLTSYRSIKEELLRPAELLMFGPEYDGRQHNIRSIWSPNHMRRAWSHIKSNRTLEVLISK